MDKDYDNTQKDHKSKDLTDILKTYIKELGKQDDEQMWETL